MSSELLFDFSQEILNLLTGSDEYDVIIYVGKGENEKTLQAHSLILKARSSYYKAALSKQWTKKEGDSNILRHPDIASNVFEIILKFSQMSRGNIYDKVWPLREILSPKLVDDIVKYHLKDISESTLVGSGHLETGESFLFSFGNRDLLEDAKISKVMRAGYAITLKDERYGPCFGDKDLWMNGNFDQPNSCSSQRDDYESQITGNQKFFVSEYEVFKIIKK
ncbi:15577_t:CDS:2 [Dentiscutata heterogama]|uniref:15577_t:CDS:1 n=1 Tax=Dentiscutata heterogama TaxID=1316150 RepID=A0ACA9N005_9GLOM|nr:15577_t:CDS:2 [Dentiscutata heterogama]